jgi:predicted dithiol-disulfide oxidoreductase (DUF899 family)
MGLTFPGESAQYRAARDRLLEDEIELRRAMERVAATRRRLPPGGVVPEDYVFQSADADGAFTHVRLSELFAPGKDSLVTYSFMFPRHAEDHRPGPNAGQTALLPLAEGPCPSCTALLDQLDGAAEHLSDRVNLVAVAKAPLPRVLLFAKERGWRHLRLLSSNGNSFKRDYHGESADGSQQPMLNVFHRDGDVIRHFWLRRCSTPPPTRDKTPATQAQSNRSSTCSTSPQKAARTTWEEQLSYPSRRSASEQTEDCR